MPHRANTSHTPSQDGIRGRLDALHSAHASDLEIILFSALVLSGPSCLSYGTERARRLYSVETSQPLSRELRYRMNALSPISTFFGSLRRGIEFIGGVGYLLLDTLAAT